MRNSPRLTTDPQPATLGSPVVSTRACGNGRPDLIGNAARLRTVGSRGYAY